MQFRYYQSYTATPQLDSYVAFEDTKLIQFNGASLLDGSGTALNAISVGNWQEICLQRIDGTLSIFLNGVRVGTSSLPGAYGDSITFVFGSSQQTYKYFDEFRFVNEPVYLATGYTPSSVPFDTNLALVLPNSSIPVADEYWSFESSKENLLSQYGLADWWGGAALDSQYLTSGEFASYHPNVDYPQWFYSSDLTTPVVLDGVVLRTNSTDIVSSYKWMNRTQIDFGAFNSGVRVPTAGFFTLLVGRATANSTTYRFGEFSFGDSYTFSVVDSDGVVHSLPFTIPAYSALTPNKSTTIATLSFGGFVVNVLGCGVGNLSGIGQLVFLQITAPFDTVTDEFIYWELVEGLETDLTATWNTDVVVMDKTEVNTPTLAIRTDIDITGYQIGGVRPSLPEKGLVWALVESSRITSLQIYNGQAWVEVDGRIWTGSRWIPYYAYDVLLLKDLYDVVGANPEKDYIYTESGFWTWLQTAWGQMMAKLEQIRVAITDGTGGGAGGDSSALPDVPPDDDGNDGWSFVDLVVELADGTWLVVRKAVGLTVGGLAGFAGLLLDVGDLFDALDPDSLGGLFVIPLE